MIKAKKNLASAILILAGCKLDQLLSGEAEPYWAIWCAASTCFAVSAIHEQEGRDV